MGKFVDLTGQRFGKLTVVSRGENHISPTNPKNSYIQWYCDCDCGATDILIRGDSLRTGNTQSCGCLQKEIASERLIKYNKKFNKYDLSGDYGIGWTSNTDEEFYFDLEDYDKIKDYCWYENDSGYLITEKNIRFHRLILDIRNRQFVVDHINHKTLDNRKINLRVCTQFENSKNTTTKYSGVYFNKDKNKWVASISYNYKSIYLGAFENFEDAVTARKQAEEEYFGEYSYDNSMEYAEQYAIN